MSKKILEILIEQRLIDEQQMVRVLNRQTKMGGKVGGHLLALGYVNPRQLAQALSKRLHTPEVDPSVLDTINKKLIVEFPINLARKYVALPLIKLGDQLSIAISDPQNHAALQDIKNQTGYKIRPFVAPENILRQKIVDYYKLDHSFLIPDKSKYQDNDWRNIDEFTVSAFDPETAIDVESYIPSQEIVLDMPSSDDRNNIPKNADNGKSNNGAFNNYQFIAAPEDPYVLELTKVSSMNAFAKEIADRLFLGLNRIVIFELFKDHIRPVSEKNWIAGHNKEEFRIHLNSINFYILLQENFYTGPLLDIVSPDLAKYIHPDVDDFSSYHSLFISLNYYQNPHYIVYGDSNGQPIPRKYIEQWKELQPKLQAALEYLIPSFEVNNSR